MKCPACEKELVKLQAGDIEIDCCRDGCGGIWFDRNELLKLDEPVEFAGHAVIKMMTAANGPTLIKERRKCPRCEGKLLTRQSLDHLNKIEMDQCWECGGVWLDAGELNTLRGQFNSYEDRSKAVSSYVDNILEQYKAGAEQRRGEAIREYNEAHDNHFRSALTALRVLLGLRDDSMDV